MSNFYAILKDALTEKHKSFEDLERDKIIPVRSFYQYKENTPFLPTILSIANYLKISLDYLCNRTIENKFKKYNIDSINFYSNIVRMLKIYNVSQKKLAFDLSIGRSNFTYWKQGKIPKLETLIAIADYFNCSLDDLIT